MSRTQTPEVAKAQQALVDRVRTGGVLAAEAILRGESPSAAVDDAEGRLAAQLLERLSVERRDSVAKAVVASAAADPAARLSDKQLVALREAAARSVQPPPPGSTKSGGRPLSELKLYLRKVRCVDESNPEASADEYVLGGVAVGPGGIKAVGPFDLGDFEDTKEELEGDDSDAITRVWDPPKTLVRWDLENAKTWPRPYQVYLIGTDHDWGEFPEVLDYAVHIVAGYLESTKDPYAVAAAVAIEVVYWFIGLVGGDDVLGGAGADVTLDDRYEDFGGTYRHSETLELADGTSHYRVGVEWNLDLQSK